jgi:hypothetical protein
MSLICLPAEASRAGWVVKYSFRTPYDVGDAKQSMSHIHGDTTDVTDYVGGFVYTNSALSFFSSPEGRVVKNGSNYEYQYAITDHLGNTRVIFTSATQSTQSVTATFETANQTTEAGEFTNYPSGAESSPKSCHD